RSLFEALDGQLDDSHARVSESTASDVAPLPAAGAARALRVQLAQLERRFEHTERYRAAECQHPADLPQRRADGARVGAFLVVVAAGLEPRVDLGEQRRAECRRNRWVQLLRL